MSRPTRDGTAEPVSRDQILRREREQGNIHFPCSADHEQDWQPYPFDPYSDVLYVMTIHFTYMLSVLLIFITYFLHSILSGRFQVFAIPWGFTQCMHAVYHEKHWTRTCCPSFLRSIYPGGVSKSGSDLMPDPQASFL